MKIVLISSNDLLGGAGIVTYRLMCALRDLGHKVKMLVFTKMSADPDVIQVSNHIVRNVKFLAERMKIYRHNGFSREELFKVSTGEHGLRVDRIKEVRDADALFINWINQGTLSLKGINRLAKMGKKIVWTMHDMWCFTGICHHAYGCMNYTAECGNCRFLGKKASVTDLSHTVWQRKADLYSHANIRFVAVSSWVKARAAESSLLKNMPITVIHNAFPSEEFSVEFSNPTPYALSDFRVIVFVAANLEDRVKGLNYAIEALNHICEHDPKYAVRTVAVFVGKVNSPDQFNCLKFPHIITGALTDPDAIHYLYSKAEVVLSTSLYETLGGALIEGMSCGAVPVSFAEGGQVDFIRHKKNGYLAEYLNAEDVANGIKWAFDAKIDRNKQHAYIEDLFSADKIARRYLELVDSM